LRVWSFVTPSLKRGRHGNLLLLLGLASAVPLVSESSGTQDRILLSQVLRVPEPGRPGLRLYIPQEEGGPVIPPGTVFPFRRLLRLVELRWRYSNPFPHGAAILKLKLALSGSSPAELTTIFYCLTGDSPLPGVPGPRIYIPQEQGGPVIVLESGPHPRPATSFSFSFTFSLDSCGFVILKRPL
jgi:hypothetical protein